MDKKNNKKINKLGLYTSIHDNLKPNTVFEVKLNIIESMCKKIIKIKIFFDKLFLIKNKNIMD
jgi:hypothetical protein